MPTSTPPAPLLVTETATPPAPATTPRATAVPAEEATPDIVATLTAGSEPRLLPPLAAPDGSVSAEVHIYDCLAVNEIDVYAFEELRLVAAGSEPTVVAEQLLYCGGLGAAGLQALFWSPDGRSLYYTAARDGQPDGCGYWERPITRYNLDTGEVEHLGGGPLSPDGARLATWLDRNVVIWDLNEGEIVRAPAITPDFDLGQIAWSPDSQAVAYLQSATYCPLSGGSSVVRLNAGTGGSELLFETATSTFGSLAWDEEGQLTLFDDAGEEWRYDFASGQLAPAP
jgi:hypothetical protein